MVAPARSATDLLSRLPAFAEERHLGGEDVDVDGEMVGKIDREMAVERDGNRRTRASHATTIRNNNYNNVNSNANNNSDTTITIIIIMVTAMPCQRRGGRQRHGRRLAAVERNDTTQWEGEAITIITIPKAMIIMIMTIVIVTPIITMIAIIMMAMTCQRWRRWHGRRPTAFRRSDARRRDGDA